MTTSVTIGQSPIPAASTLTGGETVTIDQAGVTRTATITQMGGAPYPLYTVTGYTATLPGSETAVANYASMAALLAAVPPTYQGQRIQVAGAPIRSAVGVYEGRWIAGAWDWIEA